MLIAYLFTQKFNPKNGPILTPLLIKSYKCTSSSNKAITFLNIKFHIEPIQNPNINWKWTYQFPILPNNSEQNLLTSGNKNYRNFNKKRISTVITLKWAKQWKLTEEIIIKILQTKDTCLFLTVLPLKVCISILKWSTNQMCKKVLSLDLYPKTEKDSVNP